MGRRIAVFDSGVGGLTALSDLIDNFPHEDFLYLADTLNCPYGRKSSEAIRIIVSKIFRYFEDENVKAIIIACNTATANSYDLKANVPIIRIIEPTAKIALEKGKQIAVLATNLTINIGAYQKFIPNAIGVRCSELVEIVENDLMGTKYAQDVVNKILEPIKDQVDTVILGCTHFGLLRNEIKNYLGNVRFVESSLSLSASLNEILDIQGRNIDTVGKVQILTTGDPKDLKISWFSKNYESITHINI